MTVSSARTGCVALLLAAWCVTPAIRAGELTSVGVSISDLGNPFFVQIAEGVQRKATEIGGPDAEVIVRSNSYDLDTQIAQIDDFIARGVQLIVVNAADPQGIEPAIDRAHRAGIVVIAVDVAADGADATVTSDNRQAGRVACAYLAERLQGTGRVVMIDGPPVSSVFERMAGCRSVLSDHPGIVILSDDHNGGGSRDGGLAVMTELLLAYSRIDAVFAINDPSALGADMAARYAGRDGFFIVSVDGSPDAMNALRRADSRLAATAAQDPQVMAMRGVEIGYGLLNGRRPARDPTLIPTPLVTRDNVDRYRGWTVQ